MSSWRSFFSYNKYTQIASRATRQGLKESERVAAEKRASIGVRYQVWNKGQQGEQKWIVPPTEAQQAGSNTAK